MQARAGTARHVFHEQHLTAFARDEEENETAGERAERREECGCVGLLRHAGCDRDEQGIYTANDGHTG